MLPCQRKTRSQSRRGRAHHRLTAPGYARCPNCGEVKRHHTACPKCFYVPPRGPRQDGFILEHLVAED